MVVSLEHKNWRVVPDDVKTEVWRLTRKDWRIPKEGEDWVVKTAGACWRSHKSRLKRKHYEEGLTKDQLLLRRLEETIPPDQWEKLVDYWLDEKTKQLSIRNRNNVKHRKNVHTAGSRSFARIAAAEAKDGKEPSLAAVYIETRTSKKGKNLVDDQTQAELQELGDDNAAVEDYLLRKELIKNRSGSLTLRGRGVSHRVFKKAMFEEKVQKAADAKIDLIRAECRARVNELRDQFTSVIINMLTKMKETNLPSDFEGFNPFEGLSIFNNDSNEDLCYVPENNSSVATTNSASGDDGDGSDSGDGDTDDAAGDGDTDDSTEGEED